MRYIYLLLVITLFSFYYEPHHNIDGKEVLNEEIPVIRGTPLLWGYDDAGSLFREVPTKNITKKVIEDFGFDLVVHHYYPKTSFSHNKIALQSLHDFYSKLKISWIVNLEAANWMDSFVDDNGLDWFNRPDGRHYFLFPDEILKFIGELENKPGLMYDEAAHMQNARNSVTIEGFEAPFFLTDEIAGTLEQAATRFIEEAAKISHKHKVYGLQLYTEHVFPIQFHAFAKAGFIPVSKILKENVSPAYIACAIGAAIQYDKPFWLTPDLWHLEEYPGHSIDTYRSALLLAYHMGAECIYTENISYDHNNQNKGSLVLTNSNNNNYNLTDYGKMAKWFRKSYAPENPRYYQYDELIPRVAIIRQEDTTWGQSDSFLPDWLFGVKEWRSTPQTEAWFDIWHLLSNGEISSSGLSWHNRKVSIKPYNLFYPLDGVVVFDEMVGLKHLKDVELIFLTGLNVSDATLEAVRSLVKKGAICVSLPHLAPKDITDMTGKYGVFSDGKGKWVISESFLDDTVKQHVNPFLPKENYIRYRFGDTQVIFRPISYDNNKISVEINNIFKSNKSATATSR